MGYKALYLNGDGDLTAGEFAQLDKWVHRYHKKGVMLDHNGASQEAERVFLRCTLSSGDGMVHRPIAFDTGGVKTGPLLRDLLSDYIALGYLDLSALGRPVVLEGGR